MSQLIGPEEFINDKEFVKAINNITKSLDALLKSFNSLSSSVKEAYTEVNKGSTSRKDLIRHQELAAKSTNDVANGEKELIRLRKENEKIIARKSALNSKEYQDNIKLKKEYKEQADAIKGIDLAEAKRKGNIGKYKEDIVKAYFAIQGAIILAKSAFGLFIDVLNSTGSTQDAFTATLEGWKQGFNAVKVAVDTMDFKDFSKRVREAIDEGRRYAQGLDEIDDKTRALEIAEAKLNNTILEQRKIQNSALSTLDQRIAAGEKIKKLEEDMQVIRTGIAKQAYENEITNLAAIANKTKNVTEAMKQEIQLYIERDANILASVENGKKFQNELDLIAQTSNNNTEIQQRQQFRINEAVKNGEKIYSDYLLMLRVTLPTDEKYNLLKQKTVDLERAKGSALENTLRIQSKLDSAISKDQGVKEKDQKTKNEEAYAKQREMYVKGELAMVVESEKEQEQAGIERAKAMADADQKYYDDKVKAEEEAQKRSDANYVRDRERFIEEQKLKQQAIEETKNLQIDSANAAFNLGQTLGDRRVSSIEEEKQREIDAAGENSKERERIEAEANKKIRAIRIKQWIAEKAQAISNIWINHRIAMIKNTAMVGTPAGAALNIWQRILTGLSIAAVVAEPMPKFFKGGTMKKTGFAKVGEEGFELGETKDGKMFLTPDTATTMLLPEGTKITSHEKTIERIKEMESPKIDELIKEHRLTRKAIIGRPVHNHSITERGYDYLIETHNSKRRMLDKFYGRS